jgi:hypothetical protein
MNIHAENTPPNCDGHIDQVLRQLGSVTPRPGIEDRIMARLAQEERAQAGQSRRIHFFAIPRFAIGAAAGALACLAIVAGSVSHSRRIQPILPGIGTHPAYPGVGTAGAERPADRPVTPSPAGRPRSVRRLPEGRAVISPQSQKPAGVAVPKAPPTRQ